MYKNLTIFCYFLLTSTDPADLLRLTLAGILSLMITWFIIVATSVGMAVFLGALGRELSYYTHTLNIVWLFVLPSCHCRNFLPRRVAKICVQGKPAGIQG